MERAPHRASSATSATGTSAASASAAASRNGPEKAFVDGAVELVLERAEERAYSSVVGPALEGARDVGQSPASSAASTASSTSCARRSLSSGGIAAVEDLGGAGADRLVPVLLEGRRQQRREQEEPEHDAGVARRERPAAVDDLLRPAAQVRAR